MADEPNEEAQSRGGAEAWGAIAAFEQILETMPNDVGALDALARSYEIVGDLVRARDYLVRLVRIHLDQQNAAMAASLADDLRRLGGNDEETAALLAEIEALARRGGAGGPAAGAGGPDDDIAVVESELALAWRLHAADLLDQETYAAVANDVTETASRRDGGVISALHSLHTRGFAGLDKVIAFLAQDSRTPMVPAMAFEVTPECRTLLPLGFVARRGAIPLDSIGAEAMIAVLNPQDEALRQEVRRRAGRPCHFFLTWPAHFDARLARLQAAP